MTALTRTAVLLAVLVSSTVIIRHDAAPQTATEFTVPEGLARRYGELWTLSPTEFERRARAYVVDGYGHPVLSSAEIEADRRTLRLWSARIPNTSMQAIELYGQIADAFVVWCRCPGTTTYGLDWRRMGGGAEVILRFQFDPSIGRTRWQ